MATALGDTETFPVTEVPVDGTALGPLPPRVAIISVHGCCWVSLVASPLFWGNDLVFLWGSMPATRSGHMI